MACTRRQSCIKVLFQYTVLSVLCRVLKVNVSPSSEKMRRLQLPHGSPPSTTYLFVVFVSLIYEALSFPKCKPNFIMCHSAHTGYMNKYLYQYLACLHEEASGSSVCWLLAEFSKCQL